MLDAFFSGFLQVFTWPTLPLMLIGIAVGFVVGILPGLGGVVALALMLPFTFDMSPVSAFAFLLGMMAIAGTTGDITSILLGVPGESISAAMVLDGHPMAKNGEAGRALGAALMSSLIGAVVGAFLLAAAIPIVRPVVLSFGSPEFFALAVLGIMFIAAVSGRNVLKGLIAGAVGLFLSMIGLDELSGFERYTFGNLNLWDGVSLVAVTTGIFGLPEIIDLWLKGTSISERSIGKVGGVREGVKDAFRHWGLTLRASALGTFTGIIPGLGASIGQWMAYAHAVQSSSDQSRFGKGDVRGVLGPGAANNSSLGGGLIPTIAFGVPGNVVFAILLGAFLIQGLVPGPEMLTKHLDVTFSFVWIIVATNFIAVAICFLFINQLLKITELRGALIIPPIVVLIFLGGYIDAKSWFAMFLTLSAGALGYFMERFDWPRPPLILGLVLGTLIEKSLFTSYQAYGLDLFFRPVVIIVMIIGMGIVLWPVFQRFRGQRSIGVGRVFRTDMVACAVIVVLISWALWEARDWPFEAQLFPWVIGVSLLLLAIFQFGLAGKWLALSKWRGAAPASEPAGDSPSPQPINDLSDLQAAAVAMDDGALPEASHKVRQGRALTIVLWIAGFALVISLLGFKIGGALCTFLFLRLVADESRRAIIILTIGNYLFFVLLSDILRLAILDPGFVAKWLELSSLDWFLMDPMRQLLFNG